MVRQRGPLILMQTSKAATHKARRRQPEQFHICHINVNSSGEAGGCIDAQCSLPSHDSSHMQSKGRTNHPTLTAQDSGSANHLPFVPLLASMIFSPERDYPAFPVIKQCSYISPLRIVSRITSFAILRLQKRRTQL